MATSNLFNFVEIRLTQLSKNVDDFISTTYNKSSTVLSPSDPFGLILKSVEAIFQMTMLYLKNIVKNFDFTTTTKTKLVYFATLISGHNISRAVSATGTLRLQLKAGLSVETDIPGGEIQIGNKTQITNKTNGLSYLIDLGGVDSVTYKIEAGQSYFLPIIQGVTEEIQLTGTGKINQSFSVEVPSDKFIENFRVSVKVNDVLWATRNSILDMLPGQNCVCLKTGINGGIDLFFGNNFFGNVPPANSVIKIDYLLTDGARGNLPSKKDNDFSFSDDNIFDAFANPIDIESTFFVFIENEISLGGDGESVEFTKAILPFTSRNFVLATPDQFTYTLKRLGIFSQVFSYSTVKGTLNDNGDPTDDSIVFIFLVPDINNFLQGTGNSYFDVDIGVFTLSDSEQTRILEYLKIMGTISIGTSVVIKQPEILKYIIHIYLYIFNDANQDNVRAQILNVLSNYFTFNKRRDRIPKSDLIKIIEDIDGVDSVDISFVSEANEAYHLQFTLYKESLIKADPTINPDTIILKGYDPNNVIGLDPKFGDIVITQNQLPIIRGGFSDRNKNSYAEIPTTRGLGSVNIHIEGISKRTMNI